MAARGGRGKDGRLSATRHETARMKGAPQGPFLRPIGTADPVFSSSTVLPRGLRISSTRACISFGGSLPSRLTTIITRKPRGMPSNPQLMLLRSNQPTRLASGLAASAGHWFIHCGSAITLAMSTSG